MKNRTCAIVRTAAIIRFLYVFLGLCFISSAALGQVVLNADPLETRLKAGDSAAVSVGFQNLGSSVIYVPKQRPAGAGCWEGFVAVLTAAKGAPQTIKCPIRSIRIDRNATDADLVHMVETSWSRLEPGSGNQMVLQLPTTVLARHGRMTIAIKCVAPRLAVADIRRLKQLGFAVVTGDYRAKPFGVVIQ